MSERISLKEAERKAFKYRFQDGLMDIGIGLWLLMFSVGPLLPLGDFWSIAVFVPFWAIVFLVLWLVRRYVVTPRVGVMKLGEWRQARTMRFSITMVIFLIIAMVLGVLSFVQFDSIPGWIHAARFSLIFFLAFGIAGYFLDLPRLWLYGVLVAVAPLVGEWLYVNLGASHHGYPITFGFTSGVMVLVGGGLLVRLVRSHPIQPQLPGAEEMVE